MRNSDLSYSIILVTYNRLDAFKNLVLMIKEYNWKYDHFLIIDNCSTDGTIDFLRTKKGDFNISVILNNTNIGHGAALAVGFEWLNKNTSSSYYILLEDDSIPVQTLPDELLKVITISDYDFIGIDGYNVSLGKRKQINRSGLTPVPADFCLFDGSIIKSSVIKQVGTPVKDWFMMFDDFEFCYRFKKDGYKIGLIKNSFHEVLHLGGGEKFSRSNLWRGYYQSRNHVHFLKKHFTFYLLLDFIILQSKRIFGSLMAPDRFKRINFRILGIIHGLLGKKGFTLDPVSLKFK